MTRGAVIVQGAKADFLDIKHYVKKEFGDLVWAEVNQEFKNTLRQIAINPLLGSPIDELELLGFENFRKTLVRQTRVIYEYTPELVVVHLFIHTRRDFKTHLERRLLTAC